MNSKQRRIRIGLLATIGALVVLIIIFKILKPNGKTVPDTVEAAMTVSVREVHPTNTTDVVYLPALIEANVDAVLSAEKAGRIVDIKVDRGDRIEKGQLLLQIDDRIWQANLKQAGIAARDARKNFERFKVLQESGAVAQSEFDNIEKAFIQAESREEEARINIEQCRVLSPITGIVNDRFVEPGEYVQPGTPVFQVIDKATVRVVIQIPEKDVYAIQPGDHIRFNVQPLPDRAFEGTVHFVAAQADGRNNAFRTEISVDNSDGILRPGMIAQVEFHRGINRNRISLPMAAVLPSRGDHIVYLAKDGQAIRRKVQLESITRKHAVISGGLEDGDLVIVEGNRTLGDGQRVEIIKPESTE